MRLSGAPAHATLLLASTCSSASPGSGPTFSTPPLPRLTELLQGTGSVGRHAAEQCGPQHSHVQHNGVGLRQGWSVRAGAGGANTDLNAWAWVGHSWGVQGGGWRACLLLA